MSLKYGMMFGFSLSPHIWWQFHVVLHPHVDGIKRTTNYTSKKSCPENNTKKFKILKREIFYILPPVAPMTILWWKGNGAIERVCVYEQIIWEVEPLTSIGGQQIGLENLVHTESRGGVSELWSMKLSVTCNLRKFGQPEN